MATGCKNVGNGLSNDLQGLEGKMKDFERNINAQLWDVVLEEDGTKAFVPCCGSYGLRNMYSSTFATPFCEGHASNNAYFS